MTYIHIIWYIKCHVLNGRFKKPWRILLTIGVFGLRTVFRKQLPRKTLLHYTVVCGLTYPCRGYRNRLLLKRIPTGNILLIACVPIAVASRSETWTFFARSNAGFVGSNATWGMDACVRLFWACVVLCVGSGLATGWSPVQGVLQTMCRIKKLKKRSTSKGL
jgi:hypothetical protein